MEPFENQEKCKTAVAIEMVLSTMSLFLVVLIFCIGVLLSFTKGAGVLNELTEGLHSMEGVIVLGLRIILIVHFGVLVLVVTTGYNVLKSCSRFVNSQTTECEKLDHGITACQAFCRIEAVRMVLIVISFMGELSIFNFSIILELFRNIFNVPVIFGWYFTSEFQKELENRRNEVTNVNSLYTVTISSDDRSQIQDPIEMRTSNSNRLSKLSIEMETGHKNSISEL